MKSSDANLLSVYHPAIRERSPRIRLDPGQIAWKNGLVIRATNWLGDTLMTLPAMHKLRLLVPEPCGFFVLCPASLAPVWEAADWVSEVIPLRGRRLDRAARRRLRELRPGLGVVLPNSFGAALDLVRGGVPVRIGRAGRGRRWLLTHRLVEWPRGENTGVCHQLSYYLELAASVGPVAWNTDCPPLAIPEMKKTAARLGIAPGEDTRRLALAPGAAYGPAKQWPADRFARVGRWWRKRGGEVVVVGAPRERGIGAAVAAEVPGAVNLTGQTDLRELMAVLGVVDAVVANDSGAMHLAAALDTPGVALFGSTDPVSTGPIGSRWVVIRERLECAPCFHRTCARGSATCYGLEGIEPERVCAALEALEAPSPPLSAGHPAIRNETRL